MALSETEYKQHLLFEIGGPGTLSALELELVWSRFSFQPSLELQYNYALIAAIHMLMGKYWKDYQTRTASGENLYFQQPFEHLMALAKQAQERIVALEQGPVAPAVAYDAGVDYMENFFPIPTPAGYLPDPNSAMYTGDPLWAVRDAQSAEDDV